ILLVLALYHLRRSRTGPYWRLRRQASQRGGRLLLISVILFALTFALAFYSGLAAIAFRGIDTFFRENTGFAGVVVPTLTLTPAESPTPTETATATPTATQVPTVTIAPTTTPSPTIPTLTPTPTFTLTPTQMPTITLTPSPTFEVALHLTAPASNQTPRPDANISIIAADDAITADGAPLEPQTEFPSGIQRIYLFINYENMDNRVVWSRILYRENVPIQGQSYLWSQGDQGSSFFFFGNNTGYNPGNYQVRILIGDQEASRFDFVVH
ncbi:MAG: hypothetical protein K8L99_15200, partial [Anaerolineae bacterium]|nr:hypothetical protein [Anaerolineae bacterium]